MDLFCIPLSFIHLLSVIQGGLETLWGDLTFCHQADYAPCRFIPLQTSHTLNTSRLHQGLSLFSVFMGQWELGTRNGKEYTFKTMAKKKKKTTKVTETAGKTNILPVSVFCVFHCLTSFCSRVICFPWNVSVSVPKIIQKKLLFSRLRAVKHSGLNDASDRKMPFW